MAPTFVMAIWHLRFEESSEFSITSPAHSITLFNPAFDNDVRVNDDVLVDPYTVAKHLIKLGIGIRIFLNLSSSEFAPEAFTAPAAVLCESSCPYRQFRGWIFPSLLLFFCQNCMWAIKAFF